MPEPPQLVPFLWGGAAARVQLTASNPWLDDWMVWLRHWMSPKKGAIHSVLQECPPQGPSGHTVVSLLQVYKTHVGWLGKLPCTHQHLDESKATNCRNWTTNLNLGPTN